MDLENKKNHFDKENEDNQFENDEYPWELAANKCSIALTGKAFFLLSSHPKYRAILASVLMNG